MKIAVCPLGPLETNCYIVDGHIVIDPGDDINMLDAFISRENAVPDTVIVTHGHFDHMIGCAHMKRKFSCSLCISAKDAPALSNEDVCMARGNTITKFEPVTPDIILTEGTAKFGETELEILFTPGHTPGGLCLLNTGEGVIFTGDTVMKMGFGRTDFPGGSMTDMLSSLRKLFSLDPSLIAYPGHGEQSSLEQIRKVYYR